MSAAAVPVPDFAALLASFLLTEYLAQLSDRRFTPEEQFERRTKLAYHLWKLEDQSRAAAHLIVPVLSQSLSGDIDSTMFPALEWYLDFLSGKNEQWLREVNRTQLVRFWNVIPVRRLRDRVLQTLLLVEVATIADHPDQSQIARIFLDEPATDQDEVFTSRANEVVEVLIREALIAPHPRAGAPNVRDFGMRVLRRCLAPTGIPSRRTVERALAFAGDISEETRKELENLLGI